MSQDNETCARCGKLCGYDDEKGDWFGDGKTWHDTAICGRCKTELLIKFYEYFKADVELRWHEVDNILSSFVHDDVSRYSILRVSDFERQERMREIK